MLANLQRRRLNGLKSEGKMVLAVTVHDVSILSIDQQTLREIHAWKSKIEHIYCPSMIKVVIRFQSRRVASLCARVVIER